MASLSEPTIKLTLPMPPPDLSQVWYDTAMSVLLDRGHRRVVGAYEVLISLPASIGGNPCGAILNLMRQVGMIGPDADMVSMDIVLSDHRADVLVEIAVPHDAQPRRQ